MLGVSVQVQPPFLTMNDFLSAETARSFDFGNGTVFAKSQAQ